MSGNEETRREDIRNQNVVHVQCTTTIFGKMKNQYFYFVVFFNFGKKPKFLYIGNFC